MTEGLIKSVIIVVVAVFSIITIVKWEDFPKNDCCKHLSNSDIKTCYKCSEYKPHEKVIYIWKYLR